jgi:hypothetical protein
MRWRSVVTTASLVAVSIIGMGCPGSGPKESLPWGFDFEGRGRLTDVLTCDGGKTILRAYEGRSQDGTQGSYLGMTISIDGAARYYIFSPNLDIASPKFFSFRRNEAGKLEEAPPQVRNARLAQEAPNLHALFYGKNSDCRNR